MADGEKVRTLDELKKHFDIKSVVGYFKDGRLLNWLRARYYDDEAEKVAALDNNDLQIHKKLCEIFGVKIEVDDIDVEEIALRTARLNRLKQYTFDKEILNNVDSVAFDQDDLNNLIKENVELIYLCANRFTIPLRVKNKLFIGIGKSVAVIPANHAVDFDALNVKFKNVTFDDNYLEVLKNQAVTKKIKLSEKIFDEGTVAFDTEDYVTALEKFKKSAELGYSKSFAYIGVIYATGLCGDKDVEEGRRWFKRGIEQNDPDAYGEYALTFITDDATEDEKHTAFKFMNKANDINPEDGVWWYELGEMHRKGFGTNEDIGAAILCYKKAVSLGNTDAANILGVIYREGNHVEKNFEKAFELFKMATENENVESMLNLGSMFFYGEGTDKNSSEAFKWIKKAAELGDIDAMNSLGYLYQTGEGVKKNSRKAIDCYTKSAELGSVDALVNLGYIYREGDGVKQDFANAAYYFMKAAEQNNPAAMNALGLLYAEGQGIKKDKNLAFQWYSRAANEGDIYAMGNLGNCYLFGEGTSEDIQKANYWLQKSIDGGNNYAKMYYADYFFENDDNRAVEFYGKVFEELKDGKAAYQLYQIYNDGLCGVPKDSLLAKMWENEYKKIGYQPSDSLINSFIKKFW